MDCCNERGDFGDFEAELVLVLLLSSLNSIPFSSYNESMFLPSELTLNSYDGDLGCVDIPAFSHFCDDFGL